MSLNEVAFLDLWEAAPPSTPLTNHNRQSTRMSKSPVTHPVVTQNPTNHVATHVNPKKVVPISPRLEELARSRYVNLPRLPLLSVASKSTLDSFTSVESKATKASKAKLLKTVYGEIGEIGEIHPFSRTDGFFDSKTAWRNFRVKVMKEEILSGRIEEFTDTANVEADFFKVKKKTVALRLRTMELLDKDGDAMGKTMFQSESVDSLESRG